MACGIDRDRSIQQLYHTGWTYVEGAPGQVHALAQTADGYLWLGTATGLFRFDGIQFQSYRPASGVKFLQRSVHSLYATPDGGLWVGYRYGGVSLIKDGTVTDFGRQEGLPAGTVLSFARDRKGTIWIAAGNDGVATLDGARWRRVGSESGVAGAANTVYVSRNGTVWIGTSDNVIFLPEGETQFRTAAQGLLRVRSFAESSDGVMWMAESGFGVRPVPIGGRLPASSSPAVLVGSQAIAFDDQNSLWVTSLGNGIRRVPYPDRLRPPKVRGPSAWRYSSPGVEEYTPLNGLTSDYIYCVLQDREGNVWIGTSGGLDRFRPSPFVAVPVQPISNRGALPIPSLQSFTTSAVISGDQEDVWVAGIGPQALLQIKNDAVAAQLRDKYIDCAYRDESGSIWFATPWSIFRLVDSRRNNKTFTRSADPYRYSSTAVVEGGITISKLDLPQTGGIGVGLQSRVKAITRDRMHRLWVSIGSGVFRLEHSQWTSLESIGGPRGAAMSEFTDSAGRVWFGYTNMLVMLDGEKVSTFSHEEGVLVGTITTIQGDGTDVWIGGEFGLEVFDGRSFKPVMSIDGSGFSGVSGIVRDKEGGLWFAENRGVVHLRKDQIRNLDAHAVQYETFGLLDGLTSELRGAQATPSAAQSSDGRIWFATTKGIAWIAPDRIVRNSVSPPVSVGSVLADGKAYANMSALNLPPRTKNLQIAYTATSLTIPERVRFRYKLEGQDSDWQDAGTRRAAFYTNLDPGTYRFRVIACNNDGVWNEDGATLNFTVLTAFYQTLWFKLLCVLAVVSCVWLLYLFRLKQATAHVQERLHVRMEERVRIARELHDTLLQGFQGLILRFEAVKKAIPVESPSRLMMENVLDRADSVLLEGRERVRDLRQDEVRDSELSERLAAYGEEFRRDSSIHFSLSVIGHPQSLDPIVGNEIYCIGQEALANAFRHSRAAKIEVEIIYDHNHIKLRVRDDGVGMNDQTLTRGKDGHWGLIGMRERSEKIGGQLKVWSQAGAGTEVELTISVDIAYPLASKLGRRHWFSRFFGR